MGEPQIQDLALDSDGGIEGALSVGLSCVNCGMQEEKFDITVDVQVPPAHRSGSRDPSATHVKLIHHPIEAFRYQTLGR
jgi:hypothetical protein